MGLHELIDVCCQ